MIGLPDDKWVEAVTAVVVLHAAPDAQRMGREGQEALAAALVEHVAAQLAAYKKPRAVRFVADIPKTAVGKLNRRAVRERLRDSGA